MTAGRHFLTILCLSSALSAAEPFRPAFHFTPERNWINDPNGMVWHDGEYHLFYQYNPFGEKWGHMSWGHAMSRDLMAWEHLPVALPEKDGIMIFSGSAVVDLKNTSGLGTGSKPPMVAIYTGHRQGHQDQRIAFSNDRGRTWEQYPGNPVLDLGKADFRDPKVFWHEAKSRWVMAVSLPTEKKISFYGSADLKKWDHLSDFGPAGALSGIWECPDFFELPVEQAAGLRKWVLLLNMNPGAPAGGSGCQYFVGDFDGTTFKLDADYPVAKSYPSETTRLIADFEDGNFATWTRSGASFAAGPTRPAPGTIVGFKGAGIANSFGAGDADQGTLVSPEFVIDGDWLAFRIGGGNHPETLGIRLRVDGEVVRSETGNNSSNMESRSWDVRSLRGRKAIVEIHDGHSGSDWGHVMVDHIVMGNGPAPSSGEPALWADYGPDYYATVTWSDIPKNDGRRIALGWMNNWEYAEAIPTSPWRGAMTLPRELGLRRTPDGIRLVQTPVAETAKLRHGSPLRFSGGSMDLASRWLEQQTALPETLEVSMELTGLHSQSRFALSIHTGADERTVIGYSGERIFVDRTGSGITDFHPKFAARHEAPVRVVDGRLSIRFFLDRSSLEVFAAKGETSMTYQIFPKPGDRRITIESDASAPSIGEIVIHPLKAPAQ